MNGEVRRTDMNVIVSALRASSSLLVDSHPDLTVGAITLRRFAPENPSAWLRTHCGSFHHETLSVLSVIIGRDSVSRAAFVRRLSGP